MSTETLASSDRVLDEWEYGPDAARWHADGTPDQVPTLPGLLATLQPMLNIRVDVRPFVEALNQVGEALSAFGKPFVRMAHQTDAAQHPREHIRCRLCNPAGNPKPLAINGQEYRQRKRVRRRR